MIGLLLMASCANEPVDGAVSAPAPVALSAKADLRMKRGHALVHDLETALELPADWCNELLPDGATAGTAASTATGTTQTADDANGLTCLEAHNVRLGTTWWPDGVYLPFDLPLATSGMAADRVVLKGCHVRVALDLDGDGKVFRQADLQAQQLNEAGWMAITLELTRRFYGRDPELAELRAITALAGRLEAAGHGVDRQALAACFALGTTTEALLY